MNRFAGGATNSVPVSPAESKPSTDDQVTHQLTRERERRIRGFRLPDRTPAFLSSFGLIPQHFALKQHLLRALLYRKQLAFRFEIRRDIPGLAHNPPTAF